MFQWSNGQTRVIFKVSRRQNKYQSHGRHWGICNGMRLIIIYNHGHRMDEPWCAMTENGMMWTSDVHFQASRGGLRSKVGPFLDMFFRPACHSAFLVPITGKFYTRLVQEKKTCRLSSPFSCAGCACPASLINSARHIDHCNYVAHERT